MSHKLSSFFLGMYSLKLRLAVKFNLQFDVCNFSFLIKLNIGKETLR